MEYCAVFCRKLDDCRLFLNKKVLFFVIDVTRFIHISHGFIINLFNRTHTQKKSKSKWLYGQKSLIFIWQFLSCIYVCMYLYFFVVFVNNKKRTRLAVRVSYCYAIFWQVSSIQLSYYNNDINSLLDLYSLYHFGTLVC